MDWLHPDHREKKNGLVASRPGRKEIWTGCIQTIEKREMDWLHPDHGESKNGLVSSRPWRKEIWTGFIQTIEEIKMDWLHPDHREKKIEIKNPKLTSTRACSLTWTGACETAPFNNYGNLKGTYC